MTTPESGEKHTPHIFLLIFLCFAVAIAAAGYAYYDNYAQHYRADVEQQLAAIADLKADELVLWRKERLGDATIFHNNNAFASLVRRFFQDTGNATLRSQIEAWLGQVQAAYRYDRLMLLDTRYRKRVVVPDGPERPVSYVSPETAKILSSGQVAFEDFYWNDEKRKIYLKMLVPVVAGGRDGALVGVLALRIDPEHYLYPFLVRWPTPSPTAETLLVRREGDEVVFLNEPRFQKNLALRLRMPLTIMGSPFVKGVLGQEGVMEGTDHRGTQVVAAIRGVPDSPWVLVARIDRSEVYGPLRERLCLTIALAAALLIGAGGVMGFIRRHQRARFYRARYEAAKELRESEERYRIAIEGSNDGVAIVQDLVHVYVNKRFLAMFGYDRFEELVGKPVSFIVHPDERERVLSFALARIRGEAVPGQYEFEGIRKDGTGLHIEVSANTISYQGKPAILAYFRDITPKKQYDEWVLNAQRRLADIMDSSPFGIALITPEGRFSYVNAKFQELFGYSLVDVPDGKAWFRKAYPDKTYRRKVIGAWVEDTANVVPGERIPRLFAVTCKDGAEKMVNIITVRLETGEHLITFEDRTELHTYQQNLEYLAVHDTLTGLPNRRALGDMLNRAIAKAKRGTMSSLLYMDLDNFKDINDTVGHSAGDEVLITLTGILRNAFRTEDVLFRLGGDEFAALLEGIGTGDALSAAERLRSIVAAYDFEVSGQSFRLSLSIGLIAIDGHLESKELLSKADAAMYRAKDQGKNRIVVAEVSE